MERRISTWIDEDSGMSHVQCSTKNRGTASSRTIEAGTLPKAVLTYQVISCQVGLSMVVQRLQFFRGHNKLS